MCRHGTQAMKHMVSKEHTAFRVLSIWKQGALPTQLQCMTEANNNFGFHGGSLFSCTRSFIYTHYLNVNNSSSEENIH